MLVLVVADFNPSYFWTGAPAFKQAIADVRLHGLSSLPAESPARWFRWTEQCPGAMHQPPDANPKNGFTDGWVYSPRAGGERASPSSASFLPHLSASSLTLLRANVAQPAIGQSGAWGSQLGI